MPRHEVILNYGCRRSGDDVIRPDIVGSSGHSFLFRDSVAMSALYLRTFQGLFELSRTAGRKDCQADLESSDSLGVLEHRKGQFNRTKMENDQPYNTILKP